jgi:hypothetical protein
LPPIITYQTAFAAPTQKLYRHGEGSWKSGRARAGEAVVLQVLPPVKIFLRKEAHMLKATILASALALGLAIPAQAASDIQKSNAVRPVQTALAADVVEVQSPHRNTGGEQSSLDQPSGTQSARRFVFQERRRAPASSAALART